MRNTRTILACVLPAILFACSQYVYVQPESFDYAGPASDGVSHRRLTRADFQAHKPIVPPKRGRVDAQTAVACLVDSFSVGAVVAEGNSALWETRLDHVQFRAVMYPKASWWDSKRIKQTDEARMLEHEQVHFDIAELVARQCSARLQGICVVALSPHAAMMVAKERLRDESAHMEKLLVDWTARYDLETQNGRNYIEQQRWTQAIRKKLAATDALASTARADLYRAD